MLSFRALSNRSSAAPDLDSTKMISRRRLVSSAPALFAGASLASACSQGTDAEGYEAVAARFTGEVAWMRPEGHRPYFVGTVTSLTFEFSP
jgi:hypothetical protein